MTYRVTSRLYYGAPCNANDIMRIMRRMRIEDLCPDADPFCFHFSFLFSCSLFCFHHEEGENLCSDAEDKGSLEQVYEGIPATPDFISPNFPRTYHQKDFNFCSVSFDKIYLKTPFLGFDCGESVQYSFLSPKLCFTCWGTIGQTIYPTGCICNFNFQIICLRRCRADDNDDAGEYIWF